MSHNIQQLFSRIRAYQVREYLVGKGWSVTSEEDDAVMSFEGPTHSGGQQYRLSLWASDKEARFRNRVPNVVFLLSEMEKRRPVEIALDISNQKKPEEVEPTQKAASFARFRLRNDAENAIELEHGETGRKYTVDAGDAVEVVLAGGGQIPQLSHRQDRMVFSTGSQRARVVYSATTGRSQSLRVVVDEELKRLPELEAGAVLESIGGALSRAEFELSAEGDNVSPAASQRQASVVIAALAKELPATESSTVAIWRIAARLIHRSGAGLELGGMQELLELSCADNNDAPVSVVKWLAEKSCDPS